MASSGQAAQNAVVKAGWMQRESDLLKRWKRCYCVLKTNGLFSYYSNETQVEVQGHINLPKDCFTLKVARDVSGVMVPHGSDVLSLIEIRSSQASNVFLADSADEAQVWKLVFDDVIRANRAVQRAPVMGNPPLVYNAAPPAYYASPAPAPTYVVNPAPVTVMNPGSTSRVTTTTYYPNSQQVTTVQRGYSSSYPVQQSVYTYPGQTIIPNGNGSVTTYQVPNQNTTYVYQTRYY